MIGLAICSTNLKPGNRANTNSICTSTKKNNLIQVNNIRIYIKKLDIRILVPCGILKHLVELDSLVDNMTAQNAIRFLINKYNIPLPTPPVNVYSEIKRYVYPTSNSKLQFPIITFSATFRLGQFLISPSRQPTKWFIPTKTYILEVCNDDTKTFSNTIEDMKVYATYWFSTLKYPCYCIIGHTNGLKRQIITGRIEENNGKLIFTAYISKVAYVYYKEYPENTNITILYQSANLNEDDFYIKQNDYFASN